MAKTDIPPREALYPTPVVLVTCLDRQLERGNVITIAWCGVACSVPPQVSISVRPSRYSHPLIIKERSFSVNIPTARMITHVDLCGILSGRDTDKFKACSFTSMPASKISAPLIQECPVNIECELQQTLHLGTHDMFIGKVVTVHADSNLLTPEGKIDYAKAAPITYNGGEYWSLGEKIGHYGFSGT